MLICEIEEEKIQNFSWLIYGIQLNTFIPFRASDNDSTEQ